MDGYQIILLVSVFGFTVVISLAIAGIIISRRDGRYMTERFSMLMSELSRQTAEMSKKTDLAVEFLREQSILNRQILERVDRH
jgi:hypothetical protein